MIERDGRQTFENRSRSPLVKFEEDSKFPFKMISQFLLVIFTTMQIVILFSYSNKYSRAQERLFYNIFISNDDKREVDYSRKVYLYTAKEVKEHIISSIDNYYNIDDTSLNLLTLPVQEENGVFLDIIYLNIKSSKYPNALKNPRYKLTKNDYGPFLKSELDLKHYLNEIVSFRLNYTLNSYIPNEYTNEYECTQWNILQIYNYESRAHFVVKLNIKRSLCDTINHNSSILYSFWSNLIWVHVAVLMLGIYSLISTWKYIKKVASLFIRIRTKYKIIIDHEPASDNSVYYNPLNDSDTSEYERIAVNKPTSQKKKKMKFNKWSLICLIGSVIQIFGSLLAIFDANHLLNSTEILIGFGCFFSYLYIGKYIEYAKDYSTIYITIQKSLPNVIRYVIGATPVFLGFLFFGLSVFWKSERFNSISNIMITLFSLINGDSIYDIFQELKEIYFFLGQLYLYLFCILFIAVVLNIFIAIVQEAFSATENQEKTHWMYNKNDKSYKDDTSICFPEVEIQQKNARSDRSFKNMKRPMSIKQTKSPRNSSHLIPLIQKKKFHSEYGVYEDHLLSKADSLNKKSMMTHSHEKDIEIQNKVKKEFDNVMEKIRQISEISKGIFKTKNQKVYEEVRETIFDYINENVTIKLQEIKDLFASGDKN